MQSESIGKTELEKYPEPMLVNDLQLLQQLRKVTVDERQLMLITYIQEQITKALGIHPLELDIQQPLNYMGIDSLIAVKLRNQFRNELQVEVPVVEFMQNTTIVNLATQMHEQIISENRGYSSLKAMNNQDLLEGEL